MVQEHLYSGKNPVVRLAVESRVNAILHEIKPGDRVLEAGCCEGYVATKLAQKTGAKGKVVCVDVDAQYLAAAKKRAQKMGLKNMEFTRADLAKFRPNLKFDVIVCSEVLEHVDEPSKIMRNLSDALAKSGTLVVTVPNESVLHLGRKLFFIGQSDELEEITAHKSELNSSKIVSIATKLGLRKKSVIQVPFPIVYLNEVIVLKKT